MSNQRIDDWYEAHDGKVFISFSGGKDSVVLLDLVRKRHPDVEAIYVDTGLEYPEIKKFVSTFSNHRIIKPKYSFKTVLDKYGYPIISKETATYVYEAKHTTSEYLRNKRLHGIQKDGTVSRTGMISKKYQYLVDAPFDISGKCCNIMKKNPLKQYVKDTGKYPYVGTLASESTLRMQSWMKYGCNSFETGNPQSRPLSFWTENDILTYVKNNDLEYCSVYGDIVETGNIINGVPGLRTTKCEHTGCIYCLFGIQYDDYPNRIQRLKHTHPKLYEYCLKSKEEGVLGLKDVLQYINIDYE